MHSPATPAENLRGGILMMLCMAGFAINDALIKSLANEVPLFQAIFMRGVMATTLIAVLASAQNTIRMAALRGNKRVITLRTIGEICATACFLTALYNMPLANVTAILNSMPLAITLAAWAFLGEPVGWRRMTAIAVGFLGVLLIVRPGAQDMNSYALLALLAVAFLTLRDLSTRYLPGDVPSLLVTLITSIAVTVAAGIASIFQGWAAFETTHFLILAAAALFLLIGYQCSVMCMRVGDVGFIVPFRYTILLWAIILGYFMFGDIPDLLTWLGIAVIVGAGLFTIWRENRASVQ